MKKASFYLVAVCALLNFPLVADVLNETRLYLDSANIKVLPEGLFLELEHGLLPIETIGRDEQGIFVTAYSDQKLAYCFRCELTFDPNEQSIDCPHRWFKK